MILVILGITATTFYISRGLPGVDPLAAYILPGTQLTPHAIDVLRNQLHLNDPLYIQYFYYFSSLLHGDWGFSRTADQPVSTALFVRLPGTIELSIFAVTLSVLIGLPAGIIAALRQGKVIDKFVGFFSLSGVSLPLFWIGTIFQITFFYYFRLAGLPSFPLSGRVDPAVFLLHPLRQITGLYLLDSLITGNYQFFISSLAHIILPGFTVSLIGLAAIVRTTRASMLETMSQNFIIFAKSKGIRGRALVLRHALRNAIIPVVTTAGTMFGLLLGGSVVVEVVFNWPGIGSLAAQGILNDDTNLMMGFVLVVAFMMVIVNLAVDLLYPLIDPRVKY